MKQSERRLRELIDTDLTADDLGRLARVDTLLRAAVRSDGRKVDSQSHNLHNGRAGEEAVRPSLKLVATAPATARSPVQSTEETHELKLRFGELSLIYRSLQAAKTLGALSPEDEILDDTIQLVDQALKEAV